MDNNIVGIGGPAHEDNLTVNRHDLVWNLTIVVLITSFIVIAIIVLLVYIADRFTALNTQPFIGPTGSTTLPLTINTNWGEATYAEYPVNIKYNGFPDASAFPTAQACNSNDNTIWNGEKCICVPPFFGPFCSRERHDKKYFAIGTAEPSELKFKKIKTVTADHKSFNKNTDNKKSCSWYCDTTTDCSGFIYQNNRCTLVNGNIIIPDKQTLSYDHNMEPNIYVKNPGTIRIKNFILLMARFDSLPLRWWLRNNERKFIVLKPNVIREIHFYPRDYRMVEQYTGIYSLVKFDVDDIDILIERGNGPTTYIHEYGNILNVPPSWQYRDKIYVVYI